MADKLVGITTDSCIYRFTSPSGKVYIGQTRSLKKRLNDHRSLEWKDGHCVRLQAAIRKYGWGAMLFEVLHDCTGMGPHELNTLEVREIANHESTSRTGGYNCTTGGDGGYTRTDDTKEKLRVAMLQHHRDGPGHTDEARARTSASVTLYKETHGVSDEHRTNLSRALKGRVMSNEWRENTSKAQLGRVQSDATKLKRVESNAVTRKRKICELGPASLRQVQHCGVCGKVGHKRNFCPSSSVATKQATLRKQGLLVARTCKICALTGHYAGGCGQNPNGKGVMWPARRAAFLSKK